MGPLYNTVRQLASMSSRGFAQGSFRTPWLGWLWGEYPIGEQKCAEEAEELGQKPAEGIWPGVLQDGPGGFDQRSGFRRRADGDAQVIADGWVAKPPHEDPAVAQFLQPGSGGEFRRANKNEVSLAREDLEAQGLKLMAEMAAGGNDFPKAGPVVG